MKARVLTRGGPARAADERDGRAFHSGKQCGDARLNRRKSAEAIVPGTARVGTRRRGWGLFATKPKGGNKRKPAALNDEAKAERVLGRAER
jgi:hypothetical protein